MILMFDWKLGRSKGGESLRQTSTMWHTLQPEIIAKLIPKTLFCVTEMRFPRKIIPKQFFHVILRITNESLICNFREMNSRKIFSCNWNVNFREINSEKKKNIYIYIYIYLWHTPHFMGRSCVFLAFLPSFIVKMPTTYSHWKVAVNLFFSFLVFLFFCRFLPYFSFFPLLL